MTLDAMHWVWNHSQSRGNARIALLYVADQVRTAACEVRLSYADFTGALNASRSVSKAAVRAAAESGELEVLEVGKGTRPSLYRLPKAVGYLRPTNASGPESGPLDPPKTALSGPESGPLSPDHDHASGPESGPEWAGIRPSSGPESGPHSPYPVPKQQREPGSRDERYPEQVLPLVHAMSASGFPNIRWPMKGNAWFPVIALIKAVGVQAMVEYAHRAAASAKDPVVSAQYFLRGWQELPPAPPEDTPVYRPSPRLRAVGASYSNPEDRGVF